MIQFLSYRLGTVLNGLESQPTKKTFEKILEKELGEAQKTMDLF